MDLYCKVKKDNYVKEVDLCHTGSLFFVSKCCWSITYWCFMYNLISNLIYIVSFLILIEYYF